jgi:LAS superfamily LD-carboxypeptidase LdcB
MNTNPSIKFLPFGLASVAGLVVLASPYFIGLSDSIEQAKETSKIASQEQIERSNIEQQALTSQLLRDKQLAKNQKTLIVNGYLFDEEYPPNLAKTVLHRYPNRMTVYVHDEGGYCVGIIKNKEFKFRVDSPQVCKNIATVKVEKRN